MKAAKPLILLFGVLGLVGMFLPNGPLPSVFSLFMEASKLDLLLLLAGFALPAAAAAGALNKPAAWQALVALAGFALVCIKMHIWELAPHVLDVPLGLKLITVGAAGGLIASIVGLVKPENA